VGGSQTVQVTHHNVLSTQQTGFLQSDGSAGIGQAGNGGIASSVSALSAELAKSDLVNVGGAGSINQGTNQVGLTPLDNNNGAGTLLNPDQTDQNPLLPPHHH
jgi:uncharacterized NAD-dependent epimerase/dehydratase family protein